MPIYIGQGNPTPVAPKSKGGSSADIKGPIATFDPRVINGGGIAPPTKPTIIFPTPTYTGGGGGGGGGGGYSDPYGADYLTLAQQGHQLDQDKFDWQKEQDLWNQDWMESQAQIEQAYRDKQLALEAGNLQLAQQKQADANYWEGIQSQLVQRGQAIDIMGIQRQQNADILDYQASTYATQANYETEMASIQQRYAEAEIQKQIGLANATNDAERNKIQAAYNAEVAAIAKMEDYTKRLLGVQQNQTGQFSAETDRAARMGQLALDTNKFLLEKATSPRDLFGLYFMQRGITPDWEALKAGNAAVGEAIVPQNPMNAYVPQTQAPTFSMDNPLANQVGQATSYRPGANQFLNAGSSSSSGGSGGVNSGGGGAKLAPPPAAPALNNINYDLPQVEITGPEKPYYDINPGGLIGGTPDAAMKPGLNLSTVGGPDITGKNFMNVPGLTAYYDKEKTMKIGENDLVKGGSQVWLDWVPQYASGSQGFVNDTLAITGEGIKGDNAGAELLYNPTNAPLMHMPINEPAMNLRNDMGIGGGSNTGGINKNASYKSFFDRFVNKQQPVRNTSRVTNTAQPFAAQPRTHYVQPPVQAPVNNMFTPAPTNRDKRYSVLDIDRGMTPPATGFGNSGGYRPPIPNNVQPMPSTFQPLISNTGRILNAGQYAPDMLGELERMMAMAGGVKRYALGSDVSQQYANTGMGDLYLQSSNNAHLQGQQLPSNLQMLVDHGAPVGPALAASVTGQIAPTLNVASAFNQRGGGALPSLQTFGRQSQSETENFRGYAEGVTGLPWADVIDAISRPTEHLQKAARSRF